MWCSIETPLKRNFFNLSFLFFRKAKKHVLSYVWDYYKIGILRQTYAEDIMPTPHPTNWNVLVEIARRVVGTPKDPKQAGRPKENRIKAKKHSSHATCSRCGQVGHYRATCTQVIETLQVEDASTQQPSTNTRKKRKRKSCGICHEVGHTRLTCSQRSKNSEETVD